MSDVIEGGEFAFSVKFINAAGRVLDAPLPSDAAATIDRSEAGTVAVNLDGSAGVFVASGTDGPVNLSASAGGFTSSPVALNVVPDPVPAGVKVVPA